jgi:DNA-binding protein HU-beta
MTKAELIEAVAAKAEGQLTKKAAGEVVDSLFTTIAKSIKKEGRFSYPGFGTWTLRTRKARKGRNPQTGATITIKASKTVGFRPAKELKGAL